MKRFFLIALLLLNSAFAQEAPDELTRSQRRALKKQLKEMAQRILEDPELSRQYYELATSCPDEDEVCKVQLERIVEQTVQGSALENQASGFTFGICRPEDDSRRFHPVAYSRKSYECKLSSNGNVYNRSVSRKLYGPGVWYSQNSLVLMCTGQAYGLKMGGVTFAAGAFYGVTATSLFGKAGLCLVVGAGKSTGFFVGYDRYQFESLE